MIRTSIIPADTDVKISVPKSYVGRRLEVLLYALDEVTQEEKPAYTLADLWGKLSDESACKMHQNVTEMRDEWNRDI